MHICTYYKYNRNQRNLTEHRIKQQKQLLPSNPKLTAEWQTEGVQFWLNGLGVTDGIFHLDVIL